MKPIQYCSEHYEPKKCLAELLVPSADSAAALDATKEVFDDVAVAIDEQFGEVILNLARHSVQEERARVLPEGKNDPAELWHRNARPADLEAQPRPAGLG